MIDDYTKSVVELALGLPVVYWNGIATLMEMGWRRLPIKIENIEQRDFELLYLCQYCDKLLQIFSLDLGRFGFFRYKIDKVAITVDGNILIHVVH